MLLPRDSLFIHPELPRFAFLDSRHERLARVHRTRSLHNQFRGGRLQLSAPLWGPWWLAPLFSLCAFGYFLGFYVRLGVLGRLVLGPGAFRFEGMPFLIALTVWIMLGIVVLFVLTLPLLPLILTRHQIAWKRRHRRANKLEINSTELRAMRGAEVLAAYPWKHLKAIDTGGMRFDQIDGTTEWVPFPNERIPTFFRTVARLVLRETLTWESARPVISMKVFFLGLGAIAGAASLKAAIDHWLARSGCAFPEDRQWAGWVGILIVVLLYSSAFVLHRLRTRGSPKARRTLRRWMGLAG